MTHRASAAFWSNYDALPAEVQKRADKQFALLKADPQHPSLRFKKIGERSGQDVWSARINRQYRALAVGSNGQFLWYWIGEHDVYDHLLT